MNIRSAIELVIHGKGLTVRQMLAITADNTSNNDTMIEEIATSVDEWPGVPNRVRS